MHRRHFAAIVAAAAAVAIVVAGTAAFGTDSSGTKQGATALPVAMPEPDGAEEWMYMQRANPDGSIPDAAVNEAIAQSKAAGQASKGSPATDQVWTELGPSNIGGRIRDVAADPTTQGRRLHRDRQRRASGGRPTAARRSARRGTTTCRSRWARSPSTRRASSGPARASPTTAAARPTTARASTSRPTTARRGPTWASRTATRSARSSSTRATTTGSSSPSWVRCTTPSRRVACS